jgi:hypothetical protein
MMQENSENFFPFNQRRILFQSDAQESFCQK